MQVASSAFSALAFAAVNPAMLQALAFWCLACAMLHRVHLRRIAAMLGVAVVCAALIVAPWAIRNYRVFGKAMWTRSNFGMELHVSPGRPSRGLPRTKDLAALERVYPLRALRLPR